MIVEMKKAISCRPYIMYVIPFLSDNIACVYG